MFDIYKRAFICILQNNIIMLNTHELTSQIRTRTFLALLQVPGAPSWSHCRPLLLPDPARFSNFVFMIPLPLKKIVSSHVFLPLKHPRSGFPFCGCRWWPQPTCNLPLCAFLPCYSFTKQGCVHLCGFGSSPVADVRWSFVRFHLSLFIHCPVAGPSYDF